MEVIYFISLAMFFVSFLMIGRLIAGLPARERLEELQDAALKIPAGVQVLSDRFVTPDIAAGYRRKLVEAGQPRDMTVDGLIALKVMAAVGGLIIALTLGVVFSFALSRVVLLGAIVAAVGFFAPDAWLSRLIAARKKEIGLALPDILDMLTISVEAGLGFDAALTKVVKNFRGALAEEFFRFLQETHLGRSRRDAWKNLAERTNVPDVNSFVLSVLQADTFGISIGKVLRVQAEEMRTIRRQRAEEIAMKAPVKVVFPLVLCIFPALMVVVLGPAGIRIVRSLAL